MSFSTPIWWFFLYWLPKFLHHRYGLDLVSLGPPLAAVYTLARVGSMALLPPSAARLVHQRQPQDRHAGLRPLRRAGWVCRTHLESLGGNLADQRGRGGPLG